MLVGSARRRRAEQQRHADRSGRKHAGQNLYVFLPQRHQNPSLMKHRLAYPRNTTNASIAKAARRQLTVYATTRSPIMPPVVPTAIVPAIAPIAPPAVPPSAVAPPITPG